MDHPPQDPKPLVGVIMGSRSDWPTMWALWIANSGTPSLSVLIPMILGTIFMRAAGCAINDFADRKVDGAVERTKTRPLATGVIRAREAIFVFLGLVFR